ncbi:SOS response-associated peptidase family protein [Mesorhizobium sp. B1-1-8]|uniref:SOS response-associated peptidase family protein n=1 Tax=Mesorhizobium sp. B1-1-8 TaxID=2589976 RepID=UPI001D01ECA1|nr:SOS response-associated peptidase family protein [Mesorhizobium sp. B1-1-8]UCI10790.1 SOS response-associated peptidase [Mesorhizobium sp. B1-1-8]
MCVRYTRYLSWSEIHRLYRLTAPAEIGRNDAPRYNIAPSEEAPFMTAGDDGNHQLRNGRWWLIPFWAKEMPKAATFNAREWTISPADKGRDPWHIFQPGHAPFSFAGLWSTTRILISPAARSSPSRPRRQSTRSKIVSL